MLNARRYCCGLKGGSVVATSSPLIISRSLSGFQAPSSLLAGGNGLAAAGAAAVDDAANESEALTVKVVIRVRPLIMREVTQGGSVVDVSGGPPGSLKLCDSGRAPVSFLFDAVLAAESKQADVYDVTAAPLLRKALEGFNGCIFAYGQTGSGKTFAIEGAGATAKDATAAVGANTDDAARGIIPRLAEDLFRSVALLQAAGANASAATVGSSAGPPPPRLASATVHCEYVEIYQENVADLLRDTEQSSLLELRQRPDGEIFVDGATTVHVKNAADILQVVTSGSLRRTRGETNMNAASSRSHAVLTLRLVLIFNSGAPRTAKLHIIDLAGSERVASTGAVGARLKEGAAINKSLSALGGVIAALTEAGRAHVPYRDSKLTRLLQDSLGGNSVTAMLACISPSPSSFDETLSTLRFAERVKRVRNVARVNVNDTAALVATLEAALAHSRARERLLEIALLSRLGATWPPNPEAASLLEAELNEARSGGTMVVAQQKSAGSSPSAKVGPELILLSSIASSSSSSLTTAASNNKKAKSFCSIM